MQVTRWAMAAAMIGAASPSHAETVAQVFKRVADAVVVIRATEREISDRPGAPGTAEEIGSGVLIDKDRVLTAAHVVQVADSIIVQVAGGETLAAKVVASEPYADLALLR